VKKTRFLACDDGIMPKKRNSYIKMGYVRFVMYGRKVTTCPLLLYDGSILRKNGKERLLSPGSGPKLEITVCIRRPQRR